MSKDGPWFDKRAKRALTMTTAVILSALYATQSKDHPEPVEGRWFDKALYSASLLYSASALYSA